MNKIKVMIKMLCKGFILYNRKGNFLFFEIIFYKRKKANIVGISRIRNEELIIKDSLEDMKNHVEKFIILDDCSTDGILNKLTENKKLIKIILNNFWDINRPENETIHRQLLLSEALKENFKWFFYFDADERFIGKIKQFLLNNIDNDLFDSIKIRLYDAYITEKDMDKVSKSSDKLLDYRKYFGPEYRDILMIWKNKENFRYEGIDQREPVGCKNSIIKFKCQHYGKAISVEQWEETCEYYTTNFSEPYRTKWNNRKGKAIQNLSDFGNILYPWGEDLFLNSKCLNS